MQVEQLFGTIRSATGQIILKSELIIRRFQMILHTWTFHFLVQHFRDTQLLFIYRFKPFQRSN